MKTAAQRFPNVAKGSMAHPPSGRPGVRGWREPHHQEPPGISLPWGPGTVILGQERRQAWKAGLPSLFGSKVLNWEQLSFFFRQNPFRHLPDVAWSPKPRQNSHTRGLFPDGQSWSSVILCQLSKFNVSDGRQGSKFLVFPFSTRWKKPTNLRLYLSL